MPMLKTYTHESDFKVVIPKSSDSGESIVHVYLSKCVAVQEIPHDAQFDDYGDERTIYNQFPIIEMHDVGLCAWDGRLQCWTPYLPLQKAYCDFIAERELLNKKKK